jgi:ankyrin repeat protein
LNGKFFANIFVHFEPVDHQLMNQKIHKKLAAGLHARGINPRDYDSEFSENEPEPPEAEEEEDEKELEINRAAARNDLDTVQSLLESNLQTIHTADRNGWQAIHEAVRAGHTKMVKLLITNGADMGAKTENGGSPLWWAKRTLPRGHPTINYLESIGAPEDGGEF